MAGRTPLGLHWTRIGLIAGAAVAIVGTLLPWLVGVPEKVLTWGSGTIYGITTVQGMIAAAACAGIIAIAVTGAREQRPHRGGLAGALGLAVVALGIASLVLGTTRHEIYEEIDRISPSPEVANAMIVALSKQLDDFDMGIGGVVLPIGVAIVSLFAVIGLFLRRSR